MKTLTIVIPCYNEQEVLRTLYDRLIAALDTIEIDWQVLFVDDGSSDNTVKVIKDLRKQDSRIHFMSLSRNFGKEAAMYAGLETAESDYVAVMDCDLQDPPELLGKMIDKIIRAAVYS